MPRNYAIEMPSQRARVGTIQLVLLAVGGFLILFGALRVTNLSGLTKGYQALQESEWQEAADYFQRDLERSPDRVPSRLGLTLALLGAGRIDAAEREWRVLSAQSKDPSLSDQSFDTSQLARWRGRDPRTAALYEGELLWVQSWLTAERMVKSVRLGEDRSRQLASRAEHHTVLARFRGWVVAREGAIKEAGELRERDGPWAGQNDGRESTPGLWTKRYQEVANLISRETLGNALQLATDLMESERRRVWDESPNVLRQMLDQHLTRARLDAPDNMDFQAWWLLVAGELATRNEWVRSEDGVELRPTTQIPASDLLAVAVTEMLAGPETKSGGIGTISKSEMTRRPASAARLFLALARASLALRESHKDQPSETEALLKNAEDFLTRARELMTSLGSHPELVELRDLESVVMEQAAIRFSSDLR